MSILKSALALGKSKTPIIRPDDDKRALLLPTLDASGVHERELRDFFGDKFAYTGDRPVIKGPLLCLGFTNRAGSNLLGEYLRATPSLSGFHEQLIFSTVQNSLERLKADSFPDYILKVAQSVSKGKYGFKASVDQLMMLRHANIPAMYSGGMKVIQIRREDLIGQAISYHIALQTKAWTSQRAAEIPEHEIVFDACEIGSIARRIRHSEYLMDLFVEVYEVPRIQVNYEELIAKPQAVLRKVARFTGHRAALWKSDPPKLERQAGGLNDRFRDMFRAAQKAGEVG